MTEFIFWNIKVSFSSIKYWLFSRILSLALSGVANLVRCKPVASKKKYLERACLGVNKTQRKTELSNKESSDDIWGHGSPALRRGGPTSDFLVVSQYTSYPYLLTDLLYLPTYVFMYLFIMVNRFELVLCNLQPRVLPNTNIEHIVLVKLVSLHFILWDSIRNAVKHFGH